jgi:hypothetical protein
MTAAHKLSQNVNFSQIQPQTDDGEPACALGISEIIECHISFLVKYSPAGRHRIGILIFAMLISV